VPQAPCLSNNFVGPCIPGQQTEPPCEQRVLHFQPDCQPGLHQLNRPVSATTSSGVVDLPTSGVQEPRRSPVSFA